MSDLTLAVPSEFGYVLAVALAGVLVNQWHGLEVGKYRKDAQVPYPNAYAAHAEAPAGSAKYLFNCAQRAHSNYLEHLPQFFVTLFISGLQFPKFAAAAGAAWLVGRIIYQQGYTNPTKERGSGRYVSAPIHYPALIALLGTSAYTCYTLIMG